MFSTGQAIEGAVNYTNSLAVCGSTVTGDTVSDSSNAANLTLPVIQACAAPIGPKWVASITNWLCFLIDGAGLEYRSGATCQDPLLLLHAVQALIDAGNSGVMRAYRDAGATFPPDGSLGRDNDYAFSDYNGNVYGPKASGAWPASPIFWGNNGAINFSSNSTVIAYNQFIQMGPQTGASTFTTNIPTPVGHGNAEYVIDNQSNVNQSVTTAVGVIKGVGYSSGASTITVAPGQMLILRSNQTNWIVVANSNFATSGGGGGSSYSLLDCEGNPIESGDQVATCADLSDAINNITFPDAFNPFTSTGVGAVMVLIGGIATVSNGTQLGAENTAIGTVSSFGNFGAYSHWIDDSNGIEYVSFDERWLTTTPPPGSWKLQTISEGYLSNSSTSAAGCIVGTWLRIS